MEDCPPVRIVIGAAHHNSALLRGRCEPRYSRRAFAWRRVGRPAYLPFSIRRMVNAQASTKERGGRICPQTLVHVLDSMAIEDVTPRPLRTTLDGHPVVARRADEAVPDARKLPPVRGFWWCERTQPPKINWHLATPFLSVRSVSSSLDPHPTNVRSRTSPTLFIITPLEVATTPPPALLLLVAHLTVLRFSGASRNPTPHQASYRRIYPYVSVPAANAC